MESDSGYARIPFELPGTFGVVKQWQTDNQVALTYTLLDFGRRASASEQAREQLIAANFLSNRTIQDVVFGVEQTFYAFDAVEAAVEAARENLELAKSDFASVKQRVDLGLATQPELLLAQERLAQSRFDLANCRTASARRAGQPRGRARNRGRHDVQGRSRSTTKRCRKRSTMMSKH